MANQYESYTKVVEVINNENNQPIHIESIERLIDLFVSKFPNEHILANSLNEHKNQLQKKLNYEQN